MSVSEVTQVVQAAMIVILKISAPMLLASMAVGLVISILQAATQVHEQTITFVPKLVVIALCMILLGSWMLETLKDFTTYIFNLIVSLN